MPPLWMSAWPCSLQAFAAPSSDLEGSEFETDEQNLEAWRQVGAQLRGHSWYGAGGIGTNELPVAWLVVSMIFVLSLPTLFCFVGAALLTKDVPLPGRGGTVWVKTSACGHVMLPFRSPATLLCPAG